MEDDYVDELHLFRAIAQSGTRWLLIGRQAMVAYGLPVNTADYDFWVHFDDVEVFNAALQTLGYEPTRSPVEARAIGRYALEGCDKIDVIVSRFMRAGTERLSFEEAWDRRVHLAFGDGVTALLLPCIDDLIRTKRAALRPKDVEDIFALESLKDYQKKKEAPQ